MSAVSVQSNGHEETPCGRMAVLVRCRELITIRWTRALVSNRFSSRIPISVKIIVRYPQFKPMYINCSLSYMYIISTLGVRGLFSSRTPMEHHAHPTSATTGLEGCCWWEIWRAPELYYYTDWKHQTLIRVECSLIIFRIESQVM
jgi:hypothetical protein